ncbi:MAG: ORF6N domain-containing protein [Victivallales bacterium]
MRTKQKTVIEKIDLLIHVMRGKNIMLDYDLARLYGVETKQLKRAVQRNSKRFPDDFMFQLDRQELASLRCQFGTSSHGGVRYLPLAFTEQGVAMLSGILNSARAIEMNISIMRAFVQLRHLTVSSRELALEIDKIKSRLDKHDKDTDIIFESLDRLLNFPAPPRRKIGFSENQE